MKFKRNLKVLKKFIIGIGIESDFYQYPHIRHILKCGYKNPFDVNLQYLLEHLDTYHKLP